MNVEHMNPKTKLVKIITVNTNRMNPSVGSMIMTSLGIHCVLEILSYKCKQNLCK